ncbi:MAG: hypothetical protein ACYDGN_14225 [Acidimicrobiales bacterium]
MAYHLRHNGLITCPFGWERKPVICWLRLFQDPTGDPKWIAIVTEVPGNPGGSISNQHPTVQAALLNQFGTELDSIALFHAWPKGCLSGDNARWSKIDRNGYAEDRDASRPVAECLVGQSLPDLPEHQELYRQVLDLGGGMWDEDFRRVFEAVPVADLPPPHNPAACAHHARFDQILAGLPDTDDWMDRNLEAGRLFVASLTPEDLARCYYHRDDWRVVADESIRILGACGDRPDIADYREVARRSALGEAEKGWLESLFDDPVFIGGGSYTNGQHRGCALRFSGAERAAVHTSDESLGMSCVDWVYDGGG